MSSSTETSQSLIARYSCPVDDTNTMMVTVDHPAKPSTFRRNSRRSHLGALDRLPLELLHTILSFSNLRSISRLSQTSLRGHRVVYSFPLYHVLLQNVPLALAALGKTGCIVHHSAQTVHAALLARDCISCGCFGAFLFLPSCERCCYECLLKNQGLWVIPVGLAKKCFNLNSHHIKKLPVLRSIPGFYKMGFQPVVRRVRHFNLVSVKAAKSIGVHVQESTVNLFDQNDVLQPLQRSTRKSNELEYIQWLRDAPVQPLNVDPVMLSVDSRAPHDRYCGMASVPFPLTIQNGKTENGVWCSGCEWMEENLLFEDEEEIEVALGLSSSDVDDMEELLFSFKTRARSERDFVLHVQHCYGVQRLANGA